MEAKRVEEVISRCYKDYEDNTVVKCQSDFGKVRKVVDEAIFRAGYDEGYLGGCAEIAKGAIADRDRHYKAGKRLVVEWVEKNGIIPNHIPFANIEIQHHPWQAQKKVWGIK